MSTRFRKALAAVAIGAVGALVGPALSATAASATTTIHGDVHLGSAALAQYRVGFFDPADGSVVIGTTASDGTFSLQVPSDAQGYAFAGSDPSADRAISSYRGRSFVRGVIGLHQPAKVAGVVYPDLAAALPGQLADGGTIHLRLQHSGRVTGAGDLAKGSEVSIERRNGAPIGAAAVSSTGTFRTRPLVPGTYRLVFRGTLQQLDRSRTVTVVADRTVRTAVPRLVTGGVLHGTVRSAGRAISHPVTVQVSIGGEVVRQATTSPKGTYRFAGLAAGRYTVSFAKNPVRTSDEDVALNQPTSDTYLPSIRHATIPKRHGTVRLDPVLAPAGRIAGTAPTSTSSIVLEHRDGTVVRAAVLTKAAFTLGGLTTGSYTLLAMTRSGSLARQTVHVTTGRTTKAPALVAEGSAPSLEGAVVGGTPSTGYVEVQPEPVGYVGPRMFASFDADGRFAVAHAFPGTYPVTVHGANAAARTTTVTVAAVASHVQVQRGASNGTVAFRLTSGGHQLQGVAGSATDTAGDLASVNSRYAQEYSTEAASGTYSFHNRIRTFDLDQVSAPADDGPWWFATPDDTFTVAPGATTHVSEELAIER